MRARDRLSETPGRARIGRCHRLDHLIEGDEIGRSAPERGGQQDVEQAGIVHHGKHVGGDLPFLFGAVRRGLDHGRKLAG